MGGGSITGDTMDWEFEETVTETNISISQGEHMKYFPVQEDQIPLGEEGMLRYGAHTCVCCAAEAPTALRTHRSDLYEEHPKIPAKA